MTQKRILPAYAITLGVAAVIACSTTMAIGAFPAPQDTSSLELQAPDPAGLRDIQRQARSALAKVRDSTVAVRRSRGSLASSTGVLVEEDLILTAGHVGKTPGERIWIEFNDGRIISGETLRQICHEDADIGLIRLKEPVKKIKPITLSTMEEINKGDWAMLLGFDSVGRDSMRRIPSARIGRVLRSSGARLEVDAPFDAGDSGGPVFDLQGRLTGIVSRCGRQTWQNIATNIGMIRQLLPDLEADTPPSDELLDTIPRSLRSRGHVRSPIKSRRDPELLESMNHLAWGIAPAIVELFSGDRLVGHGTIVQDEQVITKASLYARDVEQPSIRNNEGVSFDNVRPVAMDSDLDLVLLEVPGLQAPQFIWETEPQKAGTIVAVPRIDGTIRSLGVVGRDLEEAAPTEGSRPFVGIGFRSNSRPSGIRVTSVVPSSPAAKVGLEIGDIVRSMNGRTIKDRDSLRKALSACQIGELVTMNVRRGDEDRTVELRLGLRPSQNIRWTPGNTSLGTNRHTSGYGRVVRIDADIHPREVGLPVVNLDARPIGMVIARRGRTTTVVIPSDRIREAVLQMQADRDEISPEEIATQLSAYRILSTESELGSIELEAEDAFPRGDVIRRERRDDGRVTIGSWEDADDALEWMARIDRPGRFLAKAKYACGSRSSGTPIQLSIGKSTINTRTRSTDGWSDFEIHDLGEVNLDETGITLIRLEPMGSPGQNLMNLRSIELIRLDDRME